MRLGLLPFHHHPLDGCPAFTPIARFAQAGGGACWVGEFVKYVL
jgi:hypothetical protein